MMMIMMVMMTACMRRELFNTQLSGTLPPGVGNLTALSKMCGCGVLYGWRCCVGAGVILCGGGDDDDDTDAGPR